MLLLLLLLRSLGSNSLDLLLAENLCKGFTRRAPLHLLVHQHHNLSF
jgi:hypothetical protein